MTAPGLLGGKTMEPTDIRVTFGPVPSRRLGRSVGINNIPAKLCSYSCVYCQVGRTSRLQSDRAPFYRPEALLSDVQSRIVEAGSAKMPIDYLTFVPDGEPTLDVNLGEAIRLVREVGIPVAVITNGSMMARRDVREDLAEADWVSLKIDTVREDEWRRINRPHRSLSLSAILEGMLEFSESHTGTLATETMIVDGINDGPQSVAEVADFLWKLVPDEAYLTVPTRPPAESWVRGPDESTLVRVYQQFSACVERVEHLTGYEGNTFAATGDPESDLLGITAVHPIRSEAAEIFLAEAGADWSLVDRLVARGDLVEAEYGGHRFLLRTFIRQGRTSP